MNRKLVKIVRGKYRGRNSICAFWEEINADNFIWAVFTDIKAQENMIKQKSTIAEEIFNRLYNIDLLGYQMRFVDRIGEDIYKKYIGTYVGLDRKLFEVYRLEDKSLVDNNGVPISEEELKQYKKIC